ncbi:MAG TPA: hypothetical protein VGS07_29125 [Thermoanaerobaculia bacterium]|jgi:hypothetical protein|nr:hypothetical protein [Thermoanaerobaculia bacterium]
MDLNDCRARIDFAGTEADWRRFYERMFTTLGLKGAKLDREVRDAIVKGVWNEPTKHKEIAQGIQAALSNSGVICLTDTATDRLMWYSDYAGVGRGICLCFASSMPPFSAVLEVNYVSPLPTVKFSVDGGEQVDAFILSKERSTYAWEREWRYVDYNGGGGHKSLSPIALRAIVLGSLAGADMRDKVLTLVGRWKPHVAVLQAIDERTDVDLRVDGLSEALSRGPGTLLLDYLQAIPPTHRRPNLDSQLEGIADQLNACQDPAQDISALSLTREAAGVITTLYRHGGSGSSGPSYTGLAPILFELVRVVRGEPGLRI